MVKKDGKLKGGDLNANGKSHEQSSVVVWMGGEIQKQIPRKNDFLNERI